jgi:hypothetical protein
MGPGSAGVTAYSQVFAEVIARRVTNPPRPTILAVPESGGTGQ